MRAPCVSILVLILSATSVLADEVESALAILQEFAGTQTGLNSIVVENEFAGAEAQSMLDADQLVTNATNILLGGDEVVGDATQISLGSQIAKNTLTADGSTLLDGLHVQLGENLANVVVADRVERVSQQFGPGAIQSVENRASLSDIASATFSQTGRNTANLVFADLSIGGGEQFFPAGTTQTIRNLLTIGAAQPLETSSGSQEPVPVATGALTSADAALDHEIVQEGTNIGNVLIADEVLNVHRVFDGEQIVDNHVILPDPGDGAIVSRSILQSGVNIANFVSAVEVDGLTQTSEGVQIVSNRVTTPSLADLTGQLAAYTPVAENYVNVLHIRGPSDGQGFDAEALSGSTISVTQLADVPQTSTQGSGQQVQAGNAALIER